MLIYLDVREDNTLGGWSTTPFEGAVEIEVEEDHPVLESFGRYRYTNGELVEMSPEELDTMFNVPSPPTTEDRIKMMEDAILLLMLRG